MPNEHAPDQTPSPLVNSELPSWHEQEDNGQLDAYLKVLNEGTLGPQIEGISPEEFVVACQDPKTVFMDVINEGGEEVSIPFLVPLQYAPWLNKDFLFKKGYAEEKLYFSALPQAVLNANSDKSIHALYRFKEQNPDANIIIDYPETVGPLHEHFRLPTIAVDELTTSNGTEAATYHYTMDFTPNTEAIEAYEPDPSILKIEDGAFIDENFERIWEIYAGQFQALVDDHPIAGALPREELYQTLTSPQSTLYVYRNDAGQVDAFGYLVDDLDLCPWLNKEHYEAQDPALPTFYMPGIAASPDCDRSVGVSIMRQLLYDNLRKNGNWRITFECSNISAMYIPKLVQRTVEVSGLASSSGLNQLRHFYKVLNFNQ